MCHGTLLAALGAVAFVSCGQAAAEPTRDDDPPIASTERNGPEPDDIVVFGRGEAKIGVAAAASEGTVSGADLLVRPLLRVAELVEAVPGMIAAQHSGSGKANQYFLRGFNLDHGSDFTAYVDGVQMNLRSHGHGQGYLDLNGLIPEIVASEDFRKGPYRADGGDFALAGAAYFRTIDSYDRPWASAELGSYGWRRIAAGGTLENVGSGTLTLVGEGKAYDGPWQQPERLRHLAGFGKYRRQVGAVDLAVTLHAYHATWRPTEQIPERAIGSEVCPDVFCSPDPSARGRTTRLIGNVAAEGDDWKANVFGQFYDWRMFSNPTYADPDGTNAQIEQFDRRWIIGGRGQRNWSILPRLEMMLGGEVRHDHVGDVGVYRTASRRLLGSLGRYRVQESSAGLYGEVRWNPAPGLRLVGGLRGDYYAFAVRARDAAAEALGTGTGDAVQVSPKMSVAYAPATWIEFYGNWGRGFHSNDVRGAVNREAAVAPLVRGDGREVGARVQRGKVSLTATYWWLDVDSELRFVGDANSVEPTGASRRRGYELVGFWRPTSWLALDAIYTASHARYDNGDRIPNAFENAASIGAAVTAGSWEGSLRLRHLGPYPLIEDDSVRDRGSTVVNTRVAWKRGRVELYGEVLNMLASRDKDIAYLYESYLPKVDTRGPVEGRISRIVEPRTVRIGIKIYL
ncbi:TonB-dependent receptor [Sphingomonadaceae bacterium OTU29LAMAA1]|nr:TonB-dependent receptor [Sphingomonadaceae bacterium OTU29LAMAA1]